MTLDSKQMVDDQDVWAVGGTGPHGDPAMVYAAMHDDSDADESTEDEAPSDRVLSRKATP